jgi:hypothetical protein
MKNFKYLYFLMIVFALMLLAVCLFAGCKKDPLHPSTTVTQLPTDSVKINVSFHCTEIRIGYDNSRWQGGLTLFNQTYYNVTCIAQQAGQLIYVVAVNRTAIHDNIHVEILVNNIVRGSQTAVDSAYTSIHL